MTMRENPVAISVEHLRVRYDRTLALDDVTVDIRAAAMTGVLGPNGSGKSSLLKAIVRAIPSEGKITIHADRPRLAVAYVPQESAVDLDFPVTVRDVVKQGRYPHLGPFRRLRDVDRQAVALALERVGLQDLSNRPIGALSGGQRQRTFVARALAQDTQIMLLDEPFAGVDATTESAIVDVLRELRDDGRTVVVVHHALGTARAYFDDLVLLNNRVIAAGPADEVFAPAPLRAAFGGRIALFDVETGQPHDGSATQARPHAGARGAAISGVGE